MKRQIVVLFVTLWLTTLSSLADAFVTSSAYTVGPYLNEAAPQNFQAIFAYELHVSLYSGNDSEYQGQPAHYRLFRPGAMYVEPNRLINSGTIRGLWEGVIDANRPSPYDLQKGNCLFLAVRFQRKDVFRMRDVVYNIQSTHSQGLFALREDLANRPTYVIPYILGHYWGADGIRNTGDDVLYGGSSPNNAAVNEITIVWFGQSVNMDQMAGSTNAERLNNALHVFTEEFNVRPMVQVYPYDDNRTGTPIELTFPSLTVGTIYPVIRTEPTSQTVRRGKSATFNVSATGVGIRYQWQRNGQDLEGATQPTLTIPSASDVNATNYSVKVTGSYGEITSRRVSLDVVEPPPPTVATGSASSVTTSDATLSGVVNPNEETAAWWFEYGDESYSATTASQPLTATADSQSVAVSVTGLRPYHTYTYRLVAEGPGGRTYGECRTFTTERLAKPFVGYAGVYYGLIGGSGQGTVNVTLTKKGTFSGVAVYRGTRYSFTGALDQDGNVTVQLGKSGLQLSLELDIYGEGFLSGGIVGLGNEELTFVRRGVYSAADPCPYTGRYALRGTSPQIEGEASLSLRVTRLGKVTLTGHMQDGSLVRQVGYVSEDGVIRIFTQPSRGGKLSGFVAFDVTPDHALEGDLCWKKARTVSVRKPVAVVLNVVGIEQLPQR